MKSNVFKRWRAGALALLLAVAFATAGCGGPEPSSTPSASEPMPSAVATPVAVQEESQASQTPEAQDADQQQAAASPVAGAQATPTPKVKTSAAQPKVQDRGAGAAAATAQPTAKEAPAQTPAQTPQPQAPQTITCKIAIDCRTAYDAGYDLAAQVSSSGTILGTMTVEMPAGATVYDLLQKAAGQRGIPVSKTGSGSKVYVVSINSIGEGDCGGESGWMYSVNGAYVMKGCSAQKLNDGDVVKWRYTLNRGKDIGGGVG